VYDDNFSICQYDRKTKLNLSSIDDKGFLSITITDEEISIVTKDDLEIEANKVEKNWRCFRIQGKLDFDLIGTIHTILEILKKAEVSIFVISTYNTDYFMVRANMLQKALEALKKRGYEIEIASGLLPEK
jgi:uncharacterized protein